MVEVIADYGDLCGECPVWDQTTNALFWVGAVGRRFYRHQPRIRRHHIVCEGVEIYGFRRNRKGGFVITNRSGIWLWQPCESPQLLAAEVGRQERRPRRDCRVPRPGTTGSISAATRDRTGNQRRATHRPTNGCWRSRVSNDAPSIGGGDCFSGACRPQAATAPRSSASRISSGASYSR